jgi:hypothetical protein
MGHSRYYLIKDGRRVQVPSVTTILKFLGGGGKGLNIWYYQRGQESVLEALQTLVQRSLDEADERGGDEQKMPASRLLNILPPIAEHYEMSNVAADIGDVLHTRVECDLLGNEFVPGVYPADVVEKTQEMFEELWLPWKEQNEFEVLDVESEMVSPTFECGGRLDFAAALCSMRGQRIIADLKTTKKRYFSHLAQVTAYAAMWGEAHPDQPIDRVGVLRLSKIDGAVEWTQWHRDSVGVRDAMEAFVHAKALYHINKKHK